jgi:hypothetical protein
VSQCQPGQLPTGRRPDRCRRCTARFAPVPAGSSQSLTGDAAARVTRPAAASPQSGTLGTTADQPVCCRNRRAMALTESQPSHRVGRRRHAARRANGRIGAAALAGSSATQGRRQLFPATRDAGGSSRSSACLWRSAFNPRLLQVSRGRRRRLPPTRAAHRPASAIASTRAGQVLMSATRSGSGGASAAGCPGDAQFPCPRRPVRHASTW